MAEDKSAPERKQERESALVGRDKASNDTTGFIAQQVATTDDDAAARALAAINQQLNDIDPPDEPPFGWFHRELSVTTATAAATSSTDADVGVDVTDLKGYDLPASVYVRFSEVSDSLDTTVIETSSVDMDAPGTTTITTDALESGTEYNVRAVVEAVHATGTNTAFGDPITITTP